MNTFLIFVLSLLALLRVYSSEIDSGGSIPSQIEEQNLRDTWGFLSEGQKSKISLTSIEEGNFNLGIMALSRLIIQNERDSTFPKYLSYVISSINWEVYGRREKIVLKVIGFNEDCGVQLSVGAIMCRGKDHDGAIYVFNSAMNAKELTDQIGYLSFICTDADGWMSPLLIARFKGTGIDEQEDFKLLIHKIKSK